MLQEQFIKVSKHVLNQFTIYYERMVHLKVCTMKNVAQYIDHKSIPATTRQWPNFMIDVSSHAFSGRFCWDKHSHSTDTALS